MNKTKIEWCDYTINPVKGICLNNCWYCYARKMYERFKWNPKIRFKEDELKKIYEIKEPSKIFIGSTHDIFGNWIPDNWIQKIIDEIKLNPEHVFIFLTKFPERYREFNFPKNCWLGTTITGEESIDKQIEIMAIVDLIKNIKFISYEPILYEPLPENLFVDWVIMGGLTPKANHRNMWIYKLIDNFRNLGTPIFIKNNLNWHEKIQEFPQ